MAGLRGRPRSQDRGPAQPGPSGGVPGATIAAEVHPEARWPTAPAGDRRAGGQDCPACGRDGVECDLRRGFPRTVVWVPAPPPSQGQAPAASTMRWMPPAFALVLLRQTIRRSPVARPMPQQGQRGRRSTRATVSRRLSVAMEFGICRSGRSGGACGSATGGNDNRFGSSLVAAS